MNYRVWGIPAVLSREIPGNALRAFPGSFRNFSGISSGKSQPYWGCGLGDKEPLCNMFRVCRFGFLPEIRRDLEKTLLTFDLSLAGWKRLERADFAGRDLTSRKPHLLHSIFSEVSKRGWREGVGDKQTPKTSQKSSPEMCPLLLRRHRQKGTEKRPESLAYEGFPHANPLLSANPFSKLLIFAVT